MQFGIIENAVARAASPGQIEARVAEVKNANLPGGQEPRSYAFDAIKTWPLADLAGMGIYPIRSEYTAPGPYQYQAGETYALEGSEIVRRTVIADFTLMQAKAKATADMAAKRWEVETGGILWVRPSDDKAFLVATDRESQGKLDAERSAALDGLRTAEDGWKCADAETEAVRFFVMADADIVDMANKARAHVAAAFRREGQRIDQINAATTLDEIKAIEW